MKLSKTLKKVVAGVLALACVVTSISVSAKKAEAAKSYTAYLMYASGDFGISNMNKKIATVKISKDGTYTVTLKKSAIYKKDADKDDCQWPEGVTKAEGAMVLCVDVVDIMKKYGVKNEDSDKKKAKAEKNVKISNVSLKADGKSIKVDQKKLQQGWIENGKGQGMNYRLEIYNEWGKDGKTKKNPPIDLKKLSWKKSLSVTFKISYK